MKPKGTAEFATDFVVVQVRPNTPQSTEIPRRTSRIYVKPQGKKFARFVEVTPENTDQLTLEALGAQILATAK